MDLPLLLTILVKLIPLGGIILWIKNKLTRKIYVRFPDYNQAPHYVVNGSKELIKIDCRHNITIEENDFRVPIKIVFNQDCTINHCEVKHQSGCNVSPTITLDKKNQSIEILPLRLVKDDSFSIMIEYSGSLYPAELEGEIYRGEVKVDSQQTRYRRSSKFYLYSNIFFYTLYIILNTSSLLGIVITQLNSINIFILISLLLLFVLMEIFCYSLDKRCSKVTKRKSKKYI